MKGAFSSEEGVLERFIMNSLFPDNTYGQESGGDPVCIPDLKYEDYLDFHRKYYHPSNSQFATDSEFHRQRVAQFESHGGKYINGLYVSLATDAKHRSNIHIQYRASITEFFHDFLNFSGTNFFIIPIPNTAHPKTNKVLLSK